MANQLERPIGGFYDPDVQAYHYSNLMSNPTLPPADNQLYMYRGQMCSTPVSNAFFCNTNLDALQGEIARRVKEYCGRSISRQSDTEVLVVMRSVYLQYGMNASETDILPEIRMLNHRVLEYCVPNIISNLVQYDRYLTEVGRVPAPLELATNTSLAGTRGSAGDALQRFRNF